MIDNAALQAMLDRAGRIVIPPGSYDVDAIKGNVVPNAEEELGSPTQWARVAVVLYQDGGGFGTADVIIAEENYGARRSRR